MSCPVSGKKINEVQARITSGIVCILSLLSLRYKSICFFMLFDFCTRIFNMKDYAYISKFAKKLADEFPKKMIDSGRNDFASKIGWAMSLLLVILHLKGVFIGFEIVAISMSVATGIFAFKNYCIACVLFESCLKAKDLISKKKKK